jgi:hypothetical protein
LNFLKPKSDLDFPKFIIQNPLRIYRIYYGESCSSLQILQKIFYLKLLSMKRLFLDQLKFEWLEVCLNRFKLFKYHLTHADWHRAARPHRSASLPLPCSRTNSTAQVPAAAGPLSARHRPPFPSPTSLPGEATPYWSIPFPILSLHWP